MWKNGKVWDSVVGCSWSNGLSRVPVEFSRHWCLCSWFCRPILADELRLQAPMIWDIAGCNSFDSFQAGYGLSDVDISNMATCGARHGQVRR